MSRIEGMRFSDAVERLLKMGGRIRNQEWPPYTPWVIRVINDTLNDLLQWEGVKDEDEREMGPLVAEQYVGGWIWESVPH